MELNQYCVTYVGLLLSVYISFHFRGGMAIEARSNSSMGSQRLIVVFYISHGKTNYKCGHWFVV